jgi:hypothetical protein
MYEVSRKLPFDWNTEVTVSMTLKELAVVYSLLSKTSTSNVARLVEEAIKPELDVYTGHISYKMYDDVQIILKNSNVGLKA